MIEAIGSRGIWFATVDGIRLPCVHLYWLKDGNYNDPGCMPRKGQWPKFIATIVKSKRVLLTDSNVTKDRTKKSLRSMARKRKPHGYLRILDVEDVEADDVSLRFRVKGDK